MKKTLLLVAAATFASAAFAQRSAAVKKSSFVDAKSVSVVEDCAAEDLSSQGAVEGDIQTAGAVKAWYNRPAGTFYLSAVSTEGKSGYSTYYAPYLMLHSYEPYTFKSESTNASALKWKVWYQENVKPKSVEVEAESVSNVWRLETDTVPMLTATGEANAESVFQIGGFSGTTRYYSYLSTYPGNPGQLYSTTEVRHAWASPKFFASRSNRDGSVKAGAYYGTVKDASGAAAGNLLGRNTINIDAMGIAVEKPTHPYAIKAVGVRFQSLQMASATASTKIVANIYAVDQIPSYVDSYVTITPGKKLATASITLSEAMILNTPEFSKSTSTGKYSGILNIPLEEALNVEEPIFVEITGYNNENITDFTSLYSADYFEEGYGEIGYVKQNGVYMSMRGSYMAAARSTAPAILLEVENPFLTWNYSTETGEATFEKEGGSKGVEMFTYHTSAEMSVTSEDGSAVPDWVSVTVEDILKSDEFNFVSKLNVAVKPLPEGTDYREATIKIAYPGAKLLYHVKQGEQPSGINEVSVPNVQVNVVDGDFVVTCSEKSAVEIYSVAGQLVGKAQAAQGTSAVNAQNLPCGVYIVKVGGATVKVVK